MTVFASSSVSRGLVSMGLALALCVPRVAVAQGDPVRRASLSIDTSALGEASTAVEGRIDTRGQGVLRRGEVLPSDSPDDAIVHIVVRPLTGDDPGYVVNIDVRREGEVVAGSSAEIECALCTEGELVEKVEQAIGERISSFEDLPAVPAAEQPVETTPSHDEAVSVKPHGDTRGGLAAAGKAGIALMVLGAVTTGAGIGLAVREDTYPVKDGEAQRVSTKNPGYIMLGIGGATLITGIILLAVDRKHARKPRTTAAPWLIPGGAGFGLAARF